MRVFSVDDTLDLAEKFSKILKYGDCVTLQGDLGAGKTTFVQKVITTLSESPVGVTSPTFNLLQTYDVRLGDDSYSTIWHYDLFRLEHEEEAWELAIDDALEGGVTIIEWPEMIRDILPQERIDIVIDFSEYPSGRNIQFISSGNTQTRLSKAGLC